MLKLSIIIFRACSTGHPRRGKIFFINKLTLITRKVKILLLANANVFFYYLHRTFGEFDKDCATFQASRDVWHNRHRVWCIIQQVKKETIS